jgi:hypothetical protein
MHSLYSVIKALAYLVSILAFIFGFHIWRKNQIWSNKRRVTHDLMVAYKKCYDSINGLRSPWLQTKEGYTLAKEKLGREPNTFESQDLALTYKMAYKSRLNDASKEINNLISKIREAEVMYKENLRDLFDRFFKLTNKIFIWTNRRINEDFEHLDKKSTEYIEIMEYTNSMFPYSEDEITKDGFNSNNKINNTLLCEHQKIKAFLEENLKTKFFRE